MVRNRVLVVDDEAFFRKVLQELLESAGYEVALASSGHEALAEVRRCPVEVVVSDLVMDGLSGIELLLELRSLPSPPDVIMVTGNASIATAIQALKSGAKGYLLKPVNEEELLHTIQTSIEQRQLLNENSHLKAQIRLFETGQNLSSILEIERLLPQMVRSFLFEVGSGRGMAALLDAAVPVVLASEGVKEEAAQQLAERLAVVAQELQGYSILGHEDWFSEIPLDDLRQIYLLPLVHQGKNRGVVIIANDAGVDLPVNIPHANIQFLLNQASYGFENALRFRSAKEQAYFDDLTGLYNQSYLKVLLEQEIKRCERYGLQFSVLFIDLDHFKDVNDTFGHLIGSQTLVEFARLMEIGARESDVLFRYGGDEFCMVLIETGNAGAAKVAERLRSQVEHHDFSYPPDISFRLTATIGHATFPDDDRTLRGVIDLADRAMYLGKRKRNAVCNAHDL